MRRFAQFDRRARFSTWAWRIALNACLDARARRYRLPVLSEEAFGADLADGLDEAAPVPGSPAPPGLDLPRLREQVRRMEALRAATAYYRADGELRSRRDLAGRIRELLGSVGAAEDTPKASVARGGDPACHDFSRGRCGAGDER